jgi:hypothetical protein
VSPPARKTLDGTARACSSARAPGRVVEGPSSHHAQQLVVAQGESHRALGSPAAAVAEHLAHAVLAHGGVGGDDVAAPDAHAAALVAAREREHARLAPHVQLAEHTRQHALPELPGRLQ